MSLDSYLFIPIPTVVPLERQQPGGPVEGHVEELVLATHGFEQPSVR